MYSNSFLNITFAAQGINLRLNLRNHFVLSDHRVQFLYKTASLNLIVDLSSKIKLTTKDVYTYKRSKGIKLNARQIDNSIKINNVFKHHIQFKTQ